MGQNISVNKYNVHKTHRFTDDMYVKLSTMVNIHYATSYETYYRDTMKPVYDTKFNIPVYFIKYIPDGYCIIARRLNKKKFIEVKGIKYNDQDKYDNFTKGFARLVINKIY